MKVKIVSAACALVVVASAFAVAFMLPSGHSIFAASTSSASSQPSVSTNSSVSSPSAVTVQSPVTGYTAKSYNGKIGIFSSDNSTPDQVLDVNIDTLPQSEKERLDAGIHVDTHDGLLTLIENYTS
jgi:hypothetical protein